MIFDTIDRLPCYKNIWKNGVVERICRFIDEHNLETLQSGRYELAEEGENPDWLFVNIQEYETRLKEEALCEVHRKYTDLQFVIKGNEIMGYRPFRDDEVRFPENDGKDIWFYGKDGISELNVPAGMFVLFFDGELHAPCMADGEPAHVKKAVFKILPEDCS
jgi:YhcH/YjgK/YiaL family protein